MGTIQIDGSTPKLTIGNATAEDATILFDGNAQDFYIALDDSADDLLIGLGSTVGTTPAIAIDENLKVNIPVTTASTSASTGSLTTGGGAGIGADLYVGDDVYLITDSAVLGFGADKDTTLTHTDGTGLTLNSTNKLCFNDASQFIQGSSGTVLSIGATDEIDLTATAVDLNGTLNVSGVATFQATPVFPDGSLALADLDIDGGTDIGAALVDADLLIVDDGAGGTNRKTTLSRLKTYIGGGITQADQWRVTGTTTGSETPIASNWERADNSWEEIGDGMTESSGVFTFPATGKYLILAKFIGNAVNVDENTAYFNLQVTTDNSSYTTRAQAGFNAPGSSTYSSSSSIGGTLVHLLDVTNTSNDKVRLTTESFQSATQTNGDTNGNLTCIAFIKLADT